MKGKLFTEIALMFALGAARPHLAVAMDDNASERACFGEFASTFA